MKLSKQNTYFESINKIKGLPIALDSIEKLRVKDLSDEIKREREITQTYINSDARLVTHDNFEKKNDYYNKTTIPNKFLRSETLSADKNPIKPYTDINSDGEAKFKRRKGLNFQNGTFLNKDFLKREENTLIHYLQNMMVKKDDNATFSSFISNESQGSKIFINDSRLKRLELLKIKYERGRKLIKTQKVYDSLSENEDKRNQNCKNYISEEGSFFLLDPQGNFLNRWNFIILFFIIYNTIITPYKNAFSESLYTSYEDINSDFFFELTVDTIFILDILFNFFTPFTDNEENIILAHFSIFKNYISSWFATDLISSMPVAYINLIMWKYQINSPTLFQIYVTLKWSKVLRLFKLYANSKYQNNKIYKWFFSNTKVSIVIRLCICFLVVVHIIACLWSYLGNFKTTIYNHDITWISKNLISFNLDTDFAIYIGSLYFCLVTIYTIGYGDIIATNGSERIFVIIFMIIGVFLFSFVISWLSPKLVYEDKPTIIMNKKIQLLDEIADKYYIPSDLYKSIIKNLKFQHFKTSSHRWKLLENLPSNLKNKLVDYMYKKQLNRLKFLDNASYEFLIYVVPMMMTLKLIKNDLLFSIGEFVEEMYLITKGGLSLELGIYFHNIEVSKIPENNHFGEILMYTNAQSYFDLKVSTRICELCIIRKKDFSLIKMKFPEKILDILKQSCKNYKNILERRKLYIEIISNSNTDDKDAIKKLIRKAHNNYIKENHKLTYNKKCEIPGLYDDLEIWEEAENMEFKDSVAAGIESKIYDDNNNIIKDAKNLLFPSLPYNPQDRKTRNIINQSKPNQTTITKIISKQQSLNVEIIEDNINTHFKTMEFLLLQEKNPNSIVPIKNESKSPVKSFRKMKDKQNRRSRGTNYKVKQRNKNLAVTEKKQIINQQSKIYCSTNRESKINSKRRNTNTDVNKSQLFISEYKEKRRSFDNIRKNLKLNLNQLDEGDENVSLSDILEIGSLNNSVINKYGENSSDKSIFKQIEHMSNKKDYLNNCKKDEEISYKEISDEEYFQKLDKIEIMLSKMV